MTGRSKFVLTMLLMLGAVSAFGQRPRRSIPPVRAETGNEGLTARQGAPYAFGAGVVAMTRVVDTQQRAGKREAAR